MFTLSTDQRQTVKALVHTIRHDPDSGNRQAALIQIRNYSHPRVLALLQEVSKTDLNTEVRELAGKLHTRMQAELSAAPEPASAPPQPPQGIPHLRVGAAVEAHRVFLFEPRNRALLNGRRRVPAESKGSLSVRGAVLFLLLLVVIGVVFMGISIHEQNYWNYVRANGITTTATVQRAYINAGDDDSSDSYHVVYAFSYEGRTYQNNQQVDYGNYLRMEPGTAVEVRFLREDPHQSYLTGDAPETFGGSGMMFGVAMIMIGIGGALAAIPFMRRRKRLIETGVVVQGELMHIRGYRDSDNDYHIAATYLFNTPDGRVLEGHYDQMRTDMRGTPLPPRFTPVAILYADPHNYRLL